MGLVKSKWKLASSYKTNVAIVCKNTMAHKNNV
jgi:hypothetical protein